MSAASDDFVRQIELEIDLTAEQLATAIRAAGVYGLRSVIYSSPVGNPSLWKHPAPPGYVGGRFRGNWNVGLGDADTDVTLITDAGGVATEGRGLAVLSSYPRAKSWKDDFPSVHISNNLPYAMRLEHGWSSQSSGMVAQALAELEYQFGGAEL